MSYFTAITKEISDRDSQSVSELIKELNKILEIETKLSIAFYSQIDR